MLQKPKPLLPPWRVTRLKPTLTPEPFSRERVLAPACRRCSPENIAHWIVQIRGSATVAGVQYRFLTRKLPDKCELANCEDSEGSARAGLDCTGEVGISLEEGATWQCEKYFRLVIRC